MSKKITQKIKDLLTQEDLKVFESAIESMISERVKSKLGDLVVLKEEELKKQYDVMAEEYVEKELAKQLEEAKAKLMETYDGKLSNVEKKIVAKLDSFLEHVVMEQISDEIVEKVAINETLLPLVNNIKSAFAQTHIELNSDGEKKIAELTESNEIKDKQISENLAKVVELEERLEKSAIFLMISEKSAGLTNSQKKKVVGMFKDKNFEEVESKIDDYVTLIKEGEFKKTEEKLDESQKSVDDVISEEDGLKEEPKTVIKEEEEIKETISDVANRFFNEEE